MKGRNKTALFEDEMIVYIQNPKEFTKVKVKPTTTDNEYAETEMKNTILFTITPNEITYLGIHLAFYISDL